MMSSTAYNMKEPKNKSEILTQETTRKASANFEATRAAVEPLLPSPTSKPREWEERFDEKFKLSPIKTSYGDVILCTAGIPKDIKSFIAAEIEAARQRVRDEIWEECERRRRNRCSSHTDETWCDFCRHNFGYNAALSDIQKVVRP